MMLVRSAFRWSGALCLLACVACDSSKPGDSEAQPDDGAFDPIEFTALSATMVCDPLSRCCEILTEGTGGFEGCVALFVAASVTAIDEIGESIEGGRVAYDARRFRDCVEASKAQSCDDVIANRSPEPCESFLTALIPLGGYCEFDIDCIDGYCSDSACVADLADDEPCDEDTQCASAYCSDDGTCQPWDDREPLACL